MKAKINMDTFEIQFPSNIYHKESVTLMISMRTIIDYNSNSLMKEIYL